MADPVIYSKALIDSIISGKPILNTDLPPQSTLVYTLKMVKTQINDIKYELDQTAFKETLIEMIGILKETAKLSELLDKEESAIHEAQMELQTHLQSKKELLEEMKLVEQQIADSQIIDEAKYLAEKFKTATHKADYIAAVEIFIEYVIYYFT